MAPLEQEHVDQVQGMIGLAIEGLRVEMMNITDEGRQSFSQAQEFIRRHETELHASADRVSQQVQDVIDMKTELTAVLTEIRTKITEHQQVIGVADAKAEDLNGRLTTLTDQMNAYAKNSSVWLQTVEEANAVNRQVMETEFAKHAQKIELLYEGVKAKFSSLASADGPGQGRGEGNQKGKGMDKKDVAVWKLPEELNKIQFRHWNDAVETQLEMVHGYSHASYVLNRVRRSAVPIDKQSFKICFNQAEQDLKEAAKELKVDGGSEEGEFDPWLNDEHASSIDQYDFSQRTLFLNAYLIGKLNTDLHDKTISVEHQNDFELYRQVCQIVDALLENAKLHMSNAPSNLAK